jgi:hypothetical protein
MMRSESIRCEFARLLVVVNFVWPFINFSQFFPDSTVEINFLLVFAAMALLPALLFEEAGSFLLAAGVIAVASLWGPSSSALRLVIGVAPYLFILALHRHLQRRGKELIPQGVAYKALLFFVGFSVVQHIHFHVYPVIPDGLLNSLMIVVPRYNDVPYDDSGVRGVQGWASEPSGAALTCFSFCAVALRQEPEKRWHVLLLFTILTAVNRSVYCMLFLILLALVCLWHTRSRLRAVFAVAVFVLAFSYFALRTSRVTELRENADTYGLDGESNRELFRFAQVLYPLGAFPRLYRPESVFGLEIQPLGLLPLLGGYGSVLGLLLYYRIVFGRFRLSQTRSKPLAFAAILLISCTSPADFVPAIVAFTYATTPIKTAVAPSLDIAAKSWFACLWALLVGSAAAVRQETRRTPDHIQPGSQLS